MPIAKQTPLPARATATAGPPPHIPPHQVQLNIYVIILIIAAFVIGVLWTKLQYYEKGGVAGTTTTAPAAAVPPAQPPAPRVNKTPEITSSDHIHGNKNAKVTLVEYSDFECPFCKTFHPTMKEVMQTYGDNVRWVYRHFPLSFHANAQKQAEASECVAQLGGNDAFWNFADKIFERTTSNGTGFALEKLGPLAAEVGINQAAFQTCLDSGRYTQKVQDQMAAGTAEGVSGTPGTIIIGTNGDTQLIPGALPFTQVKPMIDAALK